ncbi:Unknown protein, partial [Striga hermonthica]
ICFTINYVENVFSEYVLQLNVRKQILFFSISFTRFSKTKSRKQAERGKNLWKKKNSISSLPRRESTTPTRASFPVNSFARGILTYLNFLHRLELFGDWEL